MKGPYSFGLPMNTALIGYARCSTDDQDLTAQVQAPERLGVTPDRILGEFDFSDEKLQDTTGVLPQKSRPRSSLKIGSRQISEKTLFQQDIENPITDSVPLCSYPRGSTNKPSSD